VGLPSEALAQTNSPVRNLTYVTHLTYVLCLMYVTSVMLVEPELSFLKSSPRRSIPHQPQA